MKNKKSTCLNIFLNMFQGWIAQSPGNSFLRSNANLIVIYKIRQAVPINSRPRERRRQTIFWPLLRMVVFAQSPLKRQEQVANNPGTGCTTQAMAGSSLLNHELFGDQLKQMFHLSHHPAHSDLVMRMARVQQEHGDIHLYIPEIERMYLCVCVCVVGV